MQQHIEPEDLARSLIREFCLKNNFKKTLESLDQEDKRPRAKMTKIELIRFLSMEKLIKQNKAKSSPFPTILEVLTDYLFGKFQ